MIGVCVKCGFEFADYGPCICFEQVSTFDSVSIVRETPTPKPRPLLIVGISRQRIPSDTGVGDTVERILSKMGGDQFKWVMARLGVDCGCGSRQEWLNRVYPYE